LSAENPTRRRGVLSSANFARHVFHGAASNGKTVSRRRRKEVKAEGTEKTFNCFFASFDFSLHLRRHRETLRRVVICVKI
jgi:hypothetical protein